MRSIDDTSPTPDERRAEVAAIQATGVPRLRIRTLPDADWVHCRVPAETVLIRRRLAAPRSENGASELVTHLLKECDN
jgi:hypothetical protein